MNKNNTTPRSYFGEYDGRIMLDNIPPPGLPYQEPTLGGPPLLYQDSSLTQPVSGPPLFVQAFLPSFEEKSLKQTKMKGKKINHLIIHNNQNFSITVFQVENINGVDYPMTPQTFGANQKGLFSFIQGHNLCVVANNKTTKLSITQMIRDYDVLKITKNGYNLLRDCVNVPRSITIKS